MGKGQRSTRRDRENQGMAKSPRARRTDLDLVRASPYGPAACDPPHQKAGYTTAPDHIAPNCPKKTLAFTGASIHGYTDWPTPASGAPVVPLPWGICRTLRWVVLACPNTRQAPTLTDSLRPEPLSDPYHGSSPLRRAWKFPEETSFKIWLSSDRSATSFFSRAFSLSSDFRRLA